MSVAARLNWWPSARCAKAFWSQQDLPPYRELLNDTMDWAVPATGERWLDLGCGAGALSEAIWSRTHGRIEQVVGLDCAAVNEESYRRLRTSLQPAPSDRIQFRCHDFSSGLAPVESESFHHVISGLSISYAESFDEQSGQWTTSAYDRILAEVFRVIKPGGRFVFSVNVPNPSWAKVAWKSLPSLFRGERFLQSSKRGLRMLWYGRWLKREAIAGRFHYFPADEVARRLSAAGFSSIAHRMSYCDQAYVFRAIKPNRGA
jgi:SAM-dependent methyltransferase